MIIVLALYSGKAGTLSPKTRSRAHAHTHTHTLVTLHSCFQPASLTPHTAPLQNLALRSGLEVEESHTNRETVWKSCREALGQCSGAVRH